MDLGGHGRLHLMGLDLWVGKDGMWCGGISAGFAVYSVVA